MSLSIFSSRRFPAALGITLLVIIVLESLVFRGGWVLEDRSSLTYMTKFGIMKKGPDRDVVILGTSRVLAVDAGRLQDSVKDRGYSVYNFSFPDMGYSSELYFALKRYLDYREPPELLILSFPEDNIDVPVHNDLGDWPKHIDGVPVEPNDNLPELSAYFLPYILLDSDVSILSKVKVLYNKISWGFIPSIRYRRVIERVFPYRIFYSSHERRIWSEGQGSVRSKTVKRNLNAIRHFEDTHGQMIFNGEKVVNEKILLEGALPEKTKDPGRLSEGTNYLEKTIALANEHGIKVVFFLMPVWDKRYSRMEELGWFSYISEIMRFYRKKYPNFIYYDRNMVSYPGKYFGDWSHLNSSGVEKFNSDFIPHFRTILDMSGLKGERGRPKDTGAVV